MHLDWNNAAGFTTYTTWLGIDWCSQNSSISSWKIYTQGGETSTPGWTYDGVVGHGARNVGWEVRVYSETKWTYGIAGYGISNDSCTQIRGGATGLYSWNRTCSL